MSLPNAARVVAGTAIGLAYDGLRIRIESAEAHLRWLHEFLAPHFEPVDARHCERRIVLIEDTERYRAAVDRGPDPSADLLDCFALDSSVIRLPRWTADGCTTVFHREYDVLYRVTPDGSTVFLLSPEGNGAIRTPLMRAVRELAMNHSWGTGGLFLHASALARRDRGVIIAGEKAAGKTTLLVRILRQGRVSYVANDRVLVRFRPASVSVRGMPSVVTLRSSTLDLFPDLRDRLLGSRFQQRLTLLEAHRRPADPVRPWSDGRYGLSPAQLCDLLGVRQAAACEPAMLLLPRLSREPGPSRLLRLEPAIAADRLPPALLGAGTWKKTSDLFEVGAHAAPPAEATLAQLCRRLAECLECYECVLSVSAGDEDRLAARIVDML